MSDSSTAKKQRVTDAKKTMEAPKPIKTKKGAHGTDFYLLKVSLPECASGRFSKVEVQYMRVKDKKGDKDPWQHSVEVPPATLVGAMPNSTIDFKLTGLEASTRYRARSRAKGMPDSEFGQWSTDEGANFQTDREAAAEEEETLVPPGETGAKKPTAGPSSVMDARSDNDPEDKQRYKVHMSCRRPNV